MPDVYDAIVVGAGPSGSSCAAFLAGKGRSVLLLDKAKFPRDKTCGDGISGKSVRLLRELGVIGELERRPHSQIKGVIFSSPSGQILDVPLPKDAQISGYCCRREVFDNLLFETAKARGATTRERFQVSDVIMDGGKAVGVRGLDLEGRKEMEFRGRVIVGADGATSLVAKKLSENSIDPRHHVVAIRAYYKGVKGLRDSIELHFIESILPGYFWIFPLEDGLANVGIGILTSEMQKRRINLEQSMYDAIRNVPMFRERFAEAERVSPVKGWNLPLGSHHRRAHGDGFVLVGDAASLVDPFTGEGIGNALLSGKHAAEVIDEALAREDTSAGALSEYERRLWGEIENELRTSYNLQKLGMHKFILNFVIDAAASDPAVRDVIAHTLVSEEAKKDLLSPFFYLKTVVRYPFLKLRAMARRSKSSR